MIFKTAITLTVTLLSLSVCSENANAQRGGRGGGARGTDSPAAEKGGQEATGRGRAAAGGRGAAGARGLGVTTEDLFAAIDLNEDGVITRQEMQDAMRAFIKLDVDKDGKLTLQEAGGQPTGGRGAMARGRGGQGQASDGSQRRGRQGGGSGRGRGGVAPATPAPSEELGQGNPLLDD